MNVYFFRFGDTSGDAIGVLNVMIKSRLIKVETI